MPILADNFLSDAYRRPPTAIAGEIAHRPYRVVLEEPERKANHGGMRSPRMAATTSPREAERGARQLGVRAGHGGGRISFYEPNNAALKALTPMREHASAKGFSSEPFVSLR